jgi:hypothetical protein
MGFKMGEDNKSYFVHFNKQAMRDYYKIMHAEWYNAVNEAKKIAAQSGRPFRRFYPKGRRETNIRALLLLTNSSLICRNGSLR